MSDNKIQQVAFCAVFAAGLFVATAFAESEVVDGVEWWYSPEADGVVVEGGDLSERTSVKIPDVLGGCPVTGIGEAAFAECGALETVMLPSSVTRIGSSAFIGCHSLTTVNIPAGVDCIGTGAFYDCESLGEGLVIRDGCLLIVNGECPASVEIPAGARLIAGAAFDGHGEVQSVVIPSGVTVIGDGAFVGCSALSSVSIPASVSSVGEDVFCGCPVENAVLPGRLCGIDSSILTTLEVSPGTTAIGDSAFRGCHALTSITLPSSVGYIGAEAFADCDALCDLKVPQYVCDRWLLDTFPNCESTLTNLVVQEGVTRIADNFCPGSYTLEAVRLPSTLRSIGWCAFSDCYMISSVTIPQLLCNGDYSFCFTQVFRGSLSTLSRVEVLDGTTFIAARTFVGLPELVEVSIPDSVTTIGSEAFANSPGVYDYTSIPGLVLIDGWVVECLESGIETLDLSSVRGIAEGVTFSGLKNLRSLTIGCDSVDIPHWAFAGFQSLTNVCFMGKGVSIGEGAFEGCAALTRVSIADGVSRISPYAFAGCLNLTEVVVPNSVREIGFAAFQGCYNITNMVLPFVGKERGNSSCTAESCFGYVFGPEWGSTNYSYVVTSSVFMASSDFVVSPVLESIRVQDESVLGPQAFYGYSNVVSIVFANCVTNMGAGVFGECTSLTDVTFAGGLSSIGEMAFYRCLGLKEIILPETVTDVGDHAFADSGIECVVLPDGLKRIGSCAFLYCDSLNEITIPNGVEEVGSCAFFGCHSLTDLSFPQSVTNIGSGVFANCLNLSFWAVDKGNVHYKREGELLLSRSGDRLICAAFDYLGGALPTGVVCVDNYACSCCSLLSEVTVPEGVAQLGEGAFEGCEALQKVVLPYDVSVAKKEGGVITNESYYGQYVTYTPETFASFGGCPLIVDVTVSQDMCDEGLQKYFPDSWQNITNLVAATGVERVGDFAFTNLRRLVSLTIPLSVKHIGCQAFKGCSSLKRVAVSPVVRSLSDAFPDAYSQIEEVELIGDFREIPDGMFAGCVALKSVDIPKSVVRIGERAFEQCRSISSLEVPSEVTSVGSGAFRDCAGLTRMAFEGDAPSMGEDVFFGTPRRMTIEVYASSIGWSDYAEWGELPPWGARQVVGGGSGSGTSGGGSGDGEIETRVCLTVTNVVIHYVTQSLSSEVAVPITTDTGIVNVMTEIKGGAVAIPDSWATNYPTFVMSFGSDFSQALTKPSGKFDGAGNAMLVWQDYVAGTDPTDPNSKFTASVTIVDGEPVISWSPELIAAEAAKRNYTTWGKAKLTDEKWVEVVKGREGDYNFFKVTVEMR